MAENGDPKIAGVVLAGGLGRRMGGLDKALLNLGGKPLLAWVIARLSPQVAAIAINANGDPERFRAFGLPVIADETDDRPGPLGGILAGLEWAANAGFERILTVAADTPFFPCDLDCQLRTAAELTGSQIALAASRDDRRGARLHPTFGIWPVALRHELRCAIADGTRRVLAWTDQYAVAKAVFDSDPDPFFNINKPDDMLQAQRRLGLDSS